MSWESARVQILAPFIMLVLFVGAMITATLTAGTAGAATAPPEQLQQETPVNGALSQAVTGTTEDGGQVFGTFTVERFRNQGGDLVAIGTFNGVITDSEGDVVASGAQRIAWPVEEVSVDGTTAGFGQACDILTLVLGPLHLDLLGLVVDLNQVVLEITAEQGPGNLLGNLLCAVAGLLDGTGGGSPLANLLNQILRVLNQILG